MARAPKQPLTQADVRALITRHGLDGHKKLILDGLRKAVRLKPGKPVKRRLPAGASKFGGEPDLPEGVAWPEFDGRPLHFLTQLDLADLPPRWIPTADLPRKGLMSFWYDTQGDRSYGFKRDSARWRVLYSTKATQRRAFPEHDESAYDFGEPWRPFPERRVEMAPTLTLSEDAEHELMQRLWNAGGDDDERQYRFQAQLGGRDAHGGTRMHCLLGSYLFPQADGREHAARQELGISTGKAGYTEAAQKKVDRRKQAWRLLLLLDSDRASEWLWSDAGSLSFWIRDTDLKKRRFDRIYGEMDSA
ncbi:MAG: DUF1963 domain-containing protein [Phycisphaerales bacterium JB064]